MAPLPPTVNWALPVLLLALAALWPPARTFAAAFVGGRRAFWGLCGLVGAGLAYGAMSPVRALAWRPGSNWDLTAFAVFVAMVAAEVSPAGRRILFYRQEQSTDLGAAVRSRAHPTRAALVLLGGSLIATISGLLMLWLLVYFLIRPASLQLPGVAGLQPEAGWAGVAWFAGLRAVVCLAAYSVVVAPGMNGSARWLANTRLPRIGAAWILAGLLAGAAANSSSAVPLYWLIGGTIAAFSAADLALAACVLWMFLHATGISFV